MDAPVAADREERRDGRLAHSSAAAPHDGLAELVLDPLCLVDGLAHGADVAPRRLARPARVVALGAAVLEGRHPGLEVAKADQPREVARAQAALGERGGPGPRVLAGERLGAGAGAARRERGRAPRRAAVVVVVVRERDDGRAQVAQALVAAQEGDCRVQGDDGGHARFSWRGERARAEGTRGPRTSELAEAAEGRPDSPASAFFSTLLSADGVTFPGPSAASRAFLVRTGASALDAQELENAQEDVRLARARGALEADEAK